MSHAGGVSAIERRLRKVTDDEFLRYYPRLYHVAEGGIWASVQQFGLESTSALLDRFDVRGPERDAIESRRRATSITLTHKSFGSVVIRDQAPISDAKLARCLDGMTTAEWYRMLNGLVFLWPSIERRNGMLISYNDQRHDVLTIDSQKLLAQYSDQLRLSPINSGSTQYNAVLRGQNTFVRINDCPFSEWQRRRKKRAAEVVAEIVVPYRLRAIKEVVVRVESYFGTQCTGTVWEA